MDDNPYDRAIAIRKLRREFPDVHIEEIIDMESFVRLLHAGDFDLVITDYQLMWTDGLTVLRSVKERYPDRPVIMFTGTGNEEIAARAMKEGLSDYVIKSPTHYLRLPAAVRSALQEGRTRRQAAAMEARLQSLLNRVNVGVFRLSEDGRVQEANPAFLRLLGFETIEEARSVNLHEACFPADDLPSLARRLRETGRLCCEVPLRRVNGERIWVALSETPGVAPDGSSVIDGMLEDITPRKQAEQALHALLHTLSDGVVVLDSVRRITFANATAQAYLAVLTRARVGEVLRDLGGRPVDEFLGPPDDTRWHRLSVESRSFEVNARRLEGLHTCIVRLREVPCA